MLEFLQKENAKVKNENAKLHREVCRDKTEDFLSLIEACVDVISSICVLSSYVDIQIAKLQREAAHLRQSADTAEATMKVLSQHAKALAQAHMKLQSAKEEADANIKRSAVKVRIAYGRSVTCRVWWHSYRYFWIKFNYLFGLL
jgi:cell division protein FtsB